MAPNRRDLPVVLHVGFVVRTKKKDLRLERMRTSPPNDLDVLAL